MQNLLLMTNGTFLLLSSLLVLSCSSAPTSVAQRCTAPKQEVYLYLNNRSFLDTLATTRVVIDDSVMLAKAMPRHTTSDDHFEKLIHLGEGPHRIQVQFGRYAKDTTLVIKGKMSVLAYMTYDTVSFFDRKSGLRIPYDESKNGLVIMTVVRDGTPMGAHLIK
jgi:hypothetical protein